MMATLKTYRTYAQIAPKLGFLGRRAPEAARKWCARRSIPKRNRGSSEHPLWVVAEEDVQRALDGHRFGVSPAASPTVN
jgi:hypothetical protein